MENHGPYDRLVIKTISVHFSLNKQILLLTSQEHFSEDLNKESYNNTKNFKTSQSGYESPSEHKGKFTPENEVMRPKQERQKKWWHFYVCRFQLMLTAIL